MEINLIQTRFEIVVKQFFLLGGGVLVRTITPTQYSIIFRFLNPLKMRLLVLSLFFIQFSFSSFSQGIQNLKFSYGNNLTEYKTGFLEKTLLPDNSVAENLKSNSFNTSGFSLGATLSFAISKDKSWMFTTGIFYQNFDLETSIYAYSDGSDYIFRRATIVNQLELPLLLSWRNSDKKFRYGGDFGVIKALAVWSKFQENGITSGIGMDQKFDSYTYDFSGPVNLLEKYSVYFAPSIGYDFTKKLGLEFQPFFRYQTGNESESLYSNKNGAAVIQYGINLNFVKYF